MNTDVNQPVSRRVKESFSVLRNAPTSYPVEREDFICFLETHCLSLNRKGIDSYLDDLKKRTRRDREGREIRYSASWYNQRVKAVKETVRYALDHTDLSDGQRYSVEKYLRGLKTVRTKQGVGKRERIPTVEEIQTLVERADPRLSLMIRFLAETGCRISEMLGAEVGNARRGARITRISVTGKGERTRDLRLRTSLYDEIIREFAGSRWLFEHGNRQYSRISVTNRIKALAERTIEKAVSAQMIRHYRGTRLSEQLGISKAANELGHADIRTTKAFYDHSDVTDEEFLKTLDLELISQQKGAK